MRGLRILISTPSCTWRCRYYIIIEIHTITSKLILCKILLNIIRVQINV